MRVATSGDGQVALWTASRYQPDADLRAAWGKLFRVAAWCAAVPSFALLAWSVWSRKAAGAIADKTLMGYFLTDYVAAVGVGLTALFASIALPRVRRRDVPILFGGCFAGTLFLYLPSLLAAWPVLHAKKVPAALMLSFLFPFALVMIGAFAAMLGRRKQRTAEGA